MTSIFRNATAVAITAAFCAHPAAADGPVLILGAYSPEQAVLLEAAGVDGPEDEIGIFNGRRFFSGRIAERDVVLGLTGIGLVNAENTTAEALAYFANQGIALAGIVFSGVAGGPNIGDVVVPEQWADANGSYPVDACMVAVAESLSDVPLSPFLPAEDAACTGRETAPPDTPVRTETDPQLILGGLGYSADPFGGREVPCSSSGMPPLLGCEACGAPLDTSPDPIGTGEDVIPFLDAQFYADLLVYFGFPFPGGGDGPPPAPGDPIVGDMETAAVARLAEAAGIPFIAFRAVSDGGGDPIFASAIIGFPVQFLVYQQLAADNAGVVTAEFLDRWSAEPLIVSPAAAVARVGAQLQFSIAGGCSTGDAIVWSVQEPDGGSIDASGLYTAPSALTASGQAHVVATSTLDGSVQASATVHLRRNRGRR